MKTGDFLCGLVYMDGHVVVRYLLCVGEAALIQRVIRWECWDRISKKNRGSADEL